MTGRNLHPSREDVLMDFATREDRLAPEVLRGFVQRFPEYEDELVELARDLATPEFDSVPECGAVDEALANDALTRFFEVDARLAEHTAGAEVSDPFAGLDRAGCRKVAAELGANLLFIGRLRDRLIRSEELTAGFLARLAEVLGTGAAALAEFLAGPPRVPAGLRFKADGKPEAAAKQGFQEALDSSGLSDEQKRHLASL